MTALVIAEHEHGALKGATLNTVTAAAQLGEVHVLVAGADCAAAAQAASQIAGVTKVLHADGASLGEQLAENITAQVIATSSLLPPHMARTSLRAWPPSSTWRRSARSPR